LIFRSNQQSGDESTEKYLELTEIYLNDSQNFLFYDEVLDDDKYDT